MAEFLSTAKNIERSYSVSILIIKARKKVIANEVNYGQFEKASNEAYVERENFFTVCSNVFSKNYYSKSKIYSSEGKENKGKKN